MSTHARTDHYRQATQPRLFEDAKVGAGETAVQGDMLLPANVAFNRLARQGQSELTGVLGVGSEAKGQTEC